MVTVPVVVFLIAHYAVLSGERSQSRKYEGNLMIAVIADYFATGARSSAKGVSRNRLNSRERALLVYAGLALLVLRLIAMFILPLTDTTEARYAEIARLMVETGDWITPQFAEGVPFWGKPPLHTWLAAAGMQIFGIGEASARLPILIVSLGVLWLIFQWMRARQAVDHALLVTVILGSSLLFWGASAFVMTDMVMVLGTTLSMIGFYQATSDRLASRLWGYAFFVGLAIGLLGKGPVAVVLTGIPLALWVLLGNRWTLLPRLPWISGILLCLVLTLPWYVAAELKTPGFLAYFIIGEHVQRFLESGWQGDLYGSGHAQPAGMINLYWLGALFPWSLYIPFLLLRPQSVRESFSADSDGWLSYLALWAGSPLLLFSPAANIVPAYVLPGMAPAVLLLVALWSDLFGWAGRTLRVAFISSVTLTAIMALGVIAASDISPRLLGLKTARELVYQAQHAGPNTRIWYWGRRSFSAEFYTQGKVGYLSSARELDELTRNAVPDAVAIRLSNTEALNDPSLSDFVSLGTYGRYILFVENLEGEVNQ
jgi:4-amino-4-deoxy-L-arabinose transferase-like glycosyltransferase